MKKDYLA